MSAFEKTCLSDPHAQNQQTKKKLSLPITTEMCTELNVQPLVQHMQRNITPFLTLYPWRVRRLRAAAGSGRRPDGCSRRRSAAALTVGPPRPCSSRSAPYRASAEGRAAEKREEIKLSGLMKIFYFGWMKKPVQQVTPRCSNFKYEASFGTVTAVLQLQQGTVALIASTTK